MLLDNSIAATAAENDGCMLLCQKIFGEPWWLETEDMVI